MLCLGTWWAVDLFADPDLWMVSRRCDMVSAVAGEKLDA